ncbi:MAG: proline--tRNA ligase [Acidimicrobiia bacterium]|nr:proline--tRNA ligase [Acidimicrobiia bacterium]MYB11350.1 proline--tRNA ligase [Acidimicrobiia bacterium]MYG59132.1 proline--tRNA ligase [Acidimicrobiia bacterium]MYG73747.1 proline--tRNA ligase [Acidimicrobiia bacterium]MYJ33266.1 proline--tRNA ligase [Acidimicrobiia bacterium]
MADKGVLTSQTEDFPRWYQDILNKAELADNGPVRGTMVIRPYGYALWERMQAEVDQRIKAAGADNAYFPLFIPESYLNRESDHVEGFSPELAVVTQGGGRELAEPVVVRPTSETIINAYFSKWVQSHRDLPLLINQWANVVRWEMRPRIFLRTTEFLWQEGHTAHATRQEARDYAARILHEVYRDFMESVLAIPVLIGYKTEAERFPGAINSMCLEGMMRDGKALQMGTSHELGQSFATMFDITYLDGEGNQSYVWQTSWGVSSRMVGGLIMAHGDDRGLVVPPRLAPIQVAVIAVRDAEGVVDACRRLADELGAAGMRTRVDDRTGTGFGRRATDWELKGVPVRVEIGPRDLEQGQATLVSRIGGEKEAVSLSEAPKRVESLLEAIQQSVYDDAMAWRDSRISEAATADEVREATATGFARIPWAKLGPEGEAALAEEAITVRCLQRPDGSLPQAGDEPDLVAVCGRSY